MSLGKIQVCITTFERAESLRLCLLDLEREGAQRVCIYDDCSKSDYTQATALIEGNEWKWQRAQTNHGKAGYPLLLERIWRDLAEAPAADFYVFLQDDNRLCSRFFERLLKTWESIDSSSKATLMLMTDSREAIWGATKPKRLGRADRTGWVDAIYAAPLRTLRDLDFKYPVVSVPAAATGSGAGLGLTLELRRLGRKMYRANPSLVAHVGIPSRMHGKEREKHPLLAKNFIDGEVRHAQLLRGER